VKEWSKALDVANEVRLARAELKRELKAGDIALGEYLAEVQLPAWLHKMPFEELLRHVPHLRRDVVETWLAETPIKGGALIEDLTYRKRRIVADRLAKFESAQKVRAEVRSGKRARPKGAGHHHPAKGLAGKRARRVA
jgi:hypothetical protein